MNIKCPKCGGKLADIFYDGTKSGRGLICFKCKEIYTAKDFDKIYPKKEHETKT